MAIPGKCLLLLFFLVTTASALAVASTSNSITADVPKLDYIRNLTHSMWSNGHLRTAQSLSTLWIMKLTAEFDKGAEDILATKRNFEMTYTYHFSEITKFLGSMLSCYALTRDERFLEQAKKAGIAVSLALGGNCPSVRNCSYLSLEDPDRISSMPDSINSVYLFNLGVTTLELHTLHDITRDDILQQAVNKLWQLLRDSRMQNGTFRDAILERKWYMQFAFSHLSSFYWTLLNRYLQSNGSDTEALMMVQGELDAAEKMNMFGKTPEGYTVLLNEYAGQNHPFKKSKKKLFIFADRDCTMGGFLATAARAQLYSVLTNATVNGVQVQAKKEQIEKYWNWATGLVEFCHTLITHTKAGLMPYVVYLTETIEMDQEETYRHPVDGTSVFQPELAESYFYLWRYSGDQKYRDYAWQLTLKVQRQLVEFRFIETKDNKQQQFFKIDNLISSTLKYLYLTFTDGDVLPLEQWVFNRAGQPLPICGRNPVDMQHFCKI